MSETTSVPALALKALDFFDLAVGNVPFGQYSVSDREYNKLGFNIHNSPPVTPEIRWPIPRCFRQKPGADRPSPHTGTESPAQQGWKLYGVELDSITGRIAQQLYPQARIAVRELK